MACRQALILSKHPSARHMVMRLALELPDKPYDLPANSNANRMTIRLADGCSLDPLAIFSALEYVKSHCRPWEHASPSRMVIRIALELDSKSYDLSASFNASFITIRLADGCLEDPRCIFHCFKLCKVAMRIFEARIGKPYARWRAPKVHCPLQTIFCPKKDFNNHYGLDTEGKDPRLLKDSDVLEGDWLSVFSHSRDTSSYRVKCSSIRPEQYELTLPSRWRAPKVHCPLQTIFCPKKDFNNHYGLDTEGKDPRLLKDSDVLEGDWLSVFSHSRDTSSYRVKCSSIRPEQYEDLLIFYMKVYQKRPTNMEVNVSFARAYVLQFSPCAVKAGRLVQFTWAIVGEEHNNNLKKSGHFHMHYLRWKVINGAGDSIVGTVNVEEPNIELTPPPPIAPLASHSLSVQLIDDRTKEGKLRALIEDVQCRLTVAKDEHATCLKKLEAGKVQQLSDEKFSKALSLLDEQISATKLKLASVAENEPVKRIQLASQLEAQESMQAVLGVGSSEPTNVPMLTVCFWGLKFQALAAYKRLTGILYVCSLTAS
ncbi:hypothetical protein L7F22_059214 [Adiantum nelumboides]|nr:hypothetical protein [Adiantum nelumboides]